MSVIQSKDKEGQDCMSVQPDDNTIITIKELKERLEYLRGEIKKECISYGEIAELQSLAEHIEDGDMLLLEWAGVPEMPLFKGTRERLNKIKI